MVSKEEYAELITVITGNKNILVAILNRFDTINESINILFNELKLTPKVREDVDFEKEIRHATPGISGTGAVSKEVASKPKKEFENVKGNKLEYEFEEYENREGQKNSYVIYHPDSKQMRKYIGKSLLYNGGPDEDGFLYLKHGLDWVLDKDWVVVKV